MNRYSSYSKRIVALCCVLIITGCGLTSCRDDRPENYSNEMLPRFFYMLSDVTEVDNNQGVACDSDYYYVSGSDSLAKYDKNWNLIIKNDDLFSTGFANEVNHIGDIDVYQNEIYCGVEYFTESSGIGKNIQIAVYDADTLKLKRTFDLDTKSEQNECSGIAINPDNQTIWLSSWSDDLSGRYLYKYDLKTDQYLGKIHLHASPQWIQGIAYHDGYYYLSADDGDADDDEPDHIYRVDIKDGATDGTVVLERTLNDVERQGEIEGLAFDTDNSQFMVLYNRGSQKKHGVHIGYYQGYDHEIHEVYTYNLTLSVR